MVKDGAKIWPKSKTRAGEAFCSCGMKQKEVGRLQQCCNRYASLVA